MSTNYPGAIDSFTNPVAIDALNDPAVPHASQHSDANDAITAIETALGANPAGSALALDVSQISAAAADVVTGDTEAGITTWFKLKIDGVDYAIPAYNIV